MALTPQVVDIPIGNLGENEPKHAGPIGRLIRAENCEIVQFKEGSISTGPQRNVVRQRQGFTSSTNALRDSVTGAVVADDRHSPRLLAPIGQQLVTIDHGRPSVLAEDAWIRHDKLILTQQLSERVVHTSNRIVEAPDSAWIGNVECIVWCETDAVADVSYVYIGFRDASGAWIIQPKVLYTSAAAVRVIGRVVTDGLWFWVFCPQTSPANIQAHVFNPGGVELATAGVLRNWTTTPGYYDVVAVPSVDGFSNKYSVLLAQPASYTGVGANVTVKCTAFAFDGVATVTQNSTNLATAHCSGPVAFLTNNLGDGAAYMATVGEVSGGSAMTHVYTVVNQAVTHTYDVVSVVASRVDALAGYAFVAPGNTTSVTLAISLLAHGPFSVGPIYDPALRAVVCYSVSIANAATFITQHNGVILQSRAFQVDDDWLAVTYYQSGPGSTRGGSNASVSWTSGDYMMGAAEQAIQVVRGDSVTGASHLVNSTATKLIVSQATGSITHNAGDGVVAATATWTLLNAAFVDDPYAVSAVDSFLVITGATPSSLNTSWRVISRPSATTVITQSLGGNGTAIVNSNLSGATASLAATTAINIPVDYGANGQAIPPDVAGLFFGGTATIAGALGAGNNAAYTIIDIQQNASLPGYSGSPAWNNVTKILSNNAPGVREESIPANATVTVAPPQIDLWLIGAGHFTSLDIGGTLSVQGTGNPANGGEFPITGVPNAAAVFTAGQTGLRPYIFSGSELVSVKTGIPFRFQIHSITFDSSYIGSLLQVSNAANSANDGSYTIRSVISDHVVIATPATGTTGQRNELFANTIALRLDKANSSSSSLQPCWFLSPLNRDQQTAGRFDYGIAYANWRFDVETVPNYFLLGLSSVSVRPGVGISVTLPYRAQSFTADQTVKINGTSIDLLNVLQTTVGLKDFTLSLGPGQSCNNGQTMLIPGPRASQFTLSGFGEQSINLGFEQPFFVSQTSDSTVVGLLDSTPYQVVFVAECTDENGDHVFSVPSLPLQFALDPGNNVAVYGGRLIGPTDRLVAISIYRTATQGGIPTTQHYRITNPADVNGTGFAIAREGYNYWSGFDTFEFTDNIADSQAVVGEVLYTDKGFLPRYPMPAFSFATNWRNRVLAIGWDGAIWMSGEKTDGDSLWFHPGLRFVLQTTNQPNALAPMDNYLMVLCGTGEQSYWYIPEATFPDNTGQNGTLPIPVEVQFQGACSGFAVGTKNGVVYSNTAGGLWLITRNLTNGWLSQPVQDELTKGSVVTGLTVDNNQRLYVTDAAGNMFVWDQTSGTWWSWRLPAPAALLTTFKGAPAYQDASYVMLQSALHYDKRGTAITGCPPAYELADLDFGTVRAFKCLWEMQLVGTYKGQHNLNVTLSYPDEIGQVPTEFAWAPLPGDDYIYSFNPAVEQSSTYHLAISADFTGITSPGDSFELELLTAEIGIQPGINKLPASNQKTSK